jgi:outer membrane protein assembly factor BamB
MRWTRSLLLILPAVLVFVAASLAQDLQPGDVLPDCSKIPLLSTKAPGRSGDGAPPIGQRTPSLEDSLLPDGVAIVHFCSPRAPRGGPFRSFFVEELSALQKAAHGAPYPCVVVPVVPLGEKGLRDAETILREAETEAWGNSTVYYEPTYPRPGLYRTFRPGATAYGDGDITTPWTYLVGPDRKIIAARAPGEEPGLYDWLQQNLPETIVPVPRPASTDLTIPPADPRAWPAFRRTLRRQATAERLPDTLGYTYLAWKASPGRTFSSPAVVEERVYVSTDKNGLQALSLDNGEPLGSFSFGQSWWTSPVVAGDHVYAISSSGTAVALDRMRLTRHWKQDLDGLVTSSPAVSDGAVYVGSRNGAVYALDAATGDILWKFQTGGEISSSPAVIAGLVLIGSGDRNLYALDAATGQQKWATATGAAVDSSPTIAGEEVLVGSFDGGLYSVSLADGTINWRCQLGGWVHSSPAVDDTQVFVGTVDIRRDDVPTFSWIDRKTGEIRGQF